MRSHTKVILLVLSLGLSLGYSAGLNQMIELTEAARSWVAFEGQPLYVTSATHHFQIENQTLNQMNLYDPNSKISLSPTANYRLLSLLQGMDEIKDGLRYADYFILNTHDELVAKVSRGTGSDLKPLVSAISDAGVLALADPVKATIYLYVDGELTSEGLLYQDEGDYSMERNLLMQWVGDQCYILIERPGFDNALFIRMSADGRDQRTFYLPFAYVQKAVFEHNRFFVSGYNYNPQNEDMQPMIVEITAHGEVLWTNENFGHELVMSPNGEYLAALSGHETIQLFEINRKRVREIEFEHASKASLGLTINDDGVIGIIRVPVDFFVKRNTHFAQIYFPLADKSTSVQIDPRFPKLFQLHTDGTRFYLGTGYEWLEISQ